MVIRLDCHICFCFNSIKFYIPVLGLSMVWDLWSWTQRCVLSPPGNPSNPVLSVRTFIAPRFYIRLKWQNSILHHQQTKPQTNQFFRHFLFVGNFLFLQISAFSQKWADELEKAGKMSHQDLQQAIFNAENVCCEIIGGTASVTVTSAVDLFYKELEQYDFNNPNPTMANMHFRNMIWKNSKKLGVGCTDSKVRSSLPKSKNLEFLKYHCDPPCFTQLVFNCELDCTGCISLTCLRCFFSSDCISLSLCSTTS